MYIICLLDKLNYVTLRQHQSTPAMTSKHCCFCFETNEDAYPCPHCHWSPATVADSPLYLKPGTLLHGRYEVGRVLGHSGSTTTYLAWGVKEEKKIAIKEFLPIGLVNRDSSSARINTQNRSTKKRFQQSLDRFLDEALTLTKFQKLEGLVSVSSLFKANDTGYVVMEYVEGLTLSRFIQKKGRLNWTQILGLFTRIMGVLNEAHQQGVLLGAIGPEKILLCKNNQIKLLGFTETKYEQTNQIGVDSTNKTGYASVEPQSNKSLKDPWTDVYSVAASMYFCLTGNKPPEASLRTNSDKLVKPSLLGIEISAAAELGLMRGLAAQATLRPKTIAQFYVALTKQKYEKPAVAHDPNGLVSETPPHQTSQAAVIDGPAKKSSLPRSKTSSTAIKTLSGLVACCLVLAIVIIKKSPNIGASTTTASMPSANQAQELASTNLFNHAILLKQQGRNELALPMFKHLAELGHAGAQAELSLMRNENKTGLASDIMSIHQTTGINTYQNQELAAPAFSTIPNEPGATDSLLGFLHPEDKELTDGNIKN